MTKFTKELRLPHTEDQATFAVDMSTALTLMRGSRYKVPVRAVWRLFCDYARHDPASFLAFVSMRKGFSPDTQEPTP